MAHSPKSVRMQLKPMQYGEVLSKPTRVTCSPPTSDLPYGLCNFVLVRRPSDDGGRTQAGVLKGTKCKFNARVKALM